MGLEKQYGHVRAVKVAPKTWVIAHGREQIAKDEAEAAKRTEEIKANVAAGKRN